MSSSGDVMISLSSSNQSGERLPGMNIGRNRNSGICSGIVFTPSTKDVKKLNESI